MFFLFHAIERYAHLLRYRPSRLTSKATRPSATASPVKRESSPARPPTPPSATAEEWLETCKANQVCAKKLPAQGPRPGLPNLGPARLVDLEAFPAPSQDRVRLVPQRGPVDRYVTLSYCWGRTRTLATTSRSPAPARAPHPLRPPPACTFRDAACASRAGWASGGCGSTCAVHRAGRPGRLGARERQDGRHLQPRVCDGRGRRGRRLRDAGASTRSRRARTARSTCAAARAARARRRRCRRGRRRERRPGRRRQRRRRAEHDDPPSGTLWRASAARPRLEIDASPLAARGWVCQVERILSPRILHYTHAQLFWECREALPSPRTTWRPRAVRSAGSGCQLAPSSAEAAARPAPSLAASTDTLGQLRWTRGAPRASPAPRRRRGPGAGDGLAASPAASTAPRPTPPPSRARPAARLVRRRRRPAPTRAAASRCPADKLPALSGLRARLRAPPARALPGRAVKHLRLAWGVCVAACVRGGGGGTTAAAGEDAPLSGGGGGAEARGGKRGRAGPPGAAPASTARRASRGPARDCAVEWPAWTPGGGGSMREGASATPTWPPTGPAAPRGRWPASTRSAAPRAGCALSAARVRCCAAPPPSRAGGCCAAAVAGAGPRAEARGAGEAARRRASGRRARRRRGRPGGRVGGELRRRARAVARHEHLDDDLEAGGRGPRRVAPRRGRRLASVLGGRGASAATSAWATRTCCCSSARRGARRRRWRRRRRNRGRAAVRRGGDAGARGRDGPV